VFFLIDSMNRKENEKEPIRVEDKKNSVFL